MPYSPIINAREQILINPTYTPEGIWHILPSNLEAINDNDDNTSTTYGVVFGASGNTGYLVIDAGQDINLSYSAIQWKISIQNNNNSKAYWGVEYQAIDSGEWVNVWGVYRQAPSSGDTSLSKEAIINNRWRKLRFVGIDTGSYSATFKVYFLRVFSI